MREKEKVRRDKCEGGMSEKVRRDRCESEREVVSLWGGRILIDGCLLGACVLFVVYVTIHINHSALCPYFVMWSRQLTTPLFCCL